MSAESIDHYENFPVASWLCPRPLRPAVVALYRYARVADDIADEGIASAEQRLASLARYRDCLLQEPPSTHSEDWPDIFLPLSQARLKHGLITSELADLLLAFESDQTTDSYTDRDALLAYCRCSANPVGRWMLSLYDLRDPVSLTQSDAICTALQLINFWQDVQTDVRRGRLYLPYSDALATGCAPLWQGLADAARHNRHSVAAAESPDPAASMAGRLPTEHTIAPLMQSLCAWSRSLMDRGLPLPARLKTTQGWMTALELQLVMEGGYRILDKIESQGFDTRQRRPRLHWYDWPLMLLRACRRLWDNG